MNIYAKTIIEFTILCTLGTLIAIFALFLLNIGILIFWVMILFSYLPYRIKYLLNEANDDHNLSETKDF